MRYWAAGLLLTVLLFGGGWLSSGAAPDVSRSVQHGHGGLAKLVSCHEASLLP